MLQTVADVTGLNLDGYVLTGFTGFQEMVGNVLGGVDIELPAAVADSVGWRRPRGRIAIPQRSRGAGPGQGPEVVVRGRPHPPAQRGPAAAGGPLQRPGLRAAPSPHPDQRERPVDDAPTSTPGTCWPSRRWPWTLPSPASATRWRPAGSAPPAAPRSSTSPTRRPLSSRPGRRKPRP